MATEKKLTVHVKHGTEIKPYTVPEDTTVKELKEMIGKEIGYPADELRLVWYVKDMDDMATVKTYQRKGQSDVFATLIQERPPRLKDMITIYCRRRSGQTVTMNVPRITSIKDIKKQIEVELGVPPDEQRLIFGGIVLDNERNGKECILADYRILLSDCTLHLVLRPGVGRERPPRPRDMIEIFVKTPQDTPITIDVLPTTLVKDIRLQIHDETGVPPEFQHLTYGGKTLEDERDGKACTLADYGIQQGGTSEMVLKIPGSGERSPPLEDMSEIFVQTPEGTTITINAQPTTLVKDIREKIHDETRKLPPKFQRLIFRGKTLKDDIREKIHDETRKLPPKFQRLIFRGKTLEDERDGKECTLADYQIQRSGDTVYMVYRRRLPSIRNITRDIQIDVMTLNGKRIHFDVPPTTLVKDIRKQIHDKTGVPPEFQRLIFGGKTLKDKRDGKACTLADYGIQQGTLVVSQHGTNLYMEFKSAEKDIAQSLKLPLQSVPEIPGTYGSYNPRSHPSLNPGPSGSGIPGTSGSGIPGTSGSGIPGTSSGSGTPGTSGSGIPGTSGSGIPGTSGSGIPGTSGSGILETSGSNIPGPSGSETSENISCSSTDGTALGLDDRRRFYRLSLQGTSGMFRDGDLSIMYGASQGLGIEEVVIGLSENSADFPELRAGQRRLTPVLICMPHNAILSSSLSVNLLIPPHTGIITVLYRPASDTQRHQQVGGEWRQVHDVCCFIHERSICLLLMHFCEYCIVEDTMLHPSTQPQPRHKFVSLFLRGKKPLKNKARVEVYVQWSDSRDAAPVEALRGKLVKQLAFSLVNTRPITITMQPEDGWTVRQAEKEQALYDVDLIVCTGSTFDLFGDTSTQEMVEFEVQLSQCEGREHRLNVCESYEELIGENPPSQQRSSQHRSRIPRMSSQHPGRTPQRSSEHPVSTPQGRSQHPVETPQKSSQPLAKRLTRQGITNQINPPKMGARGSGTSLKAGPAQFHTATEGNMSQQLRAVSAGMLVSDTDYHESMNSSHSASAADGPSSESGLGESRCDAQCDMPSSTELGSDSDSDCDEANDPEARAEAAVAMALEGFSGTGQDSAALALPNLPRAPGAVYYVKVTNYHNHDAISQPYGSLRNWPIPYEKCAKVAEYMDLNDHDWKMLASKLRFDKAIDKVELNAKNRQASPTILLLREWTQEHRTVDATILNERLVEALTALRRIDIVDEMAELNIADEMDELDSTDE